MTATLLPVAARLDRAGSRAGMRAGTRAGGRAPGRGPGRGTAGATSRPSRTTASQGGLLLASLVIVWVPAVLLGGAVQLSVALGAGALLAVAFLLGCARQRTRARRIAATRTRGVLENAATAGAVHGWVEGLALSQVTVGHVVLNPSGALVVSSVWHGLGLSDATLERDATEVRAAATHTRELIRARGDETTCRALVAVWGAAASDLPGGGLEVGEVLFVRGRDLGDLLAWTSAHGGAWSHARAAELMLDLSDVPSVDSTLVLTAS